MNDEGAFVLATRQRKLMDNHGIRVAGITDAYLWASKAELNSTSPCTLDQVNCEEEPAIARVPWNQPRSQSQPAFMVASMTIMTIKRTPTPSPPTATEEYGMRHPSLRHRHEAQTTWCVERKPSYRVHTACLHTMSQMPVRGLWLWRKWMAA